MDIQDIISLTLSVTSLIIALVALYISMGVAKTSISTPLILQELNELSEEYHGKSEGDGINERVARIAKWTQLVQRKQFILRKAGFEEQLGAFLRALTEYSGTRHQIIDEGSKPTEEQQERLLSQIGDVSRLLEEMISDIDHKLDGIFENPFARRA